MCGAPKARRPAATRRPNWSLSAVTMPTTAGTAPRTRGRHRHTSPSRRRPPVLEAAADSIELSCVAPTVFVGDTNPGPNPVVGVSVWTKNSQWRSSTHSPTGRTSTEGTSNTRYRSSPRTRVSEAKKLELLSLHREEPSGWLDFVVGEEGPAYDGNCCVGLRRDYPGSYSKLVLCALGSRQIRVNPEVNPDTFLRIDHVGPMQTLQDVDRAFAGTGRPQGPKPPLSGSRAHGPPERLREPLSLANGGNGLFPSSACVMSSTGRG
jgi:hypothetical protein